MKGTIHTGVYELPATVPALNYYIEVIIQVILL
jgi:hypothetical protein